MKQIINRSLSLLFCLMAGGSAIFSQELALGHKKPEPEVSESRPSTQIAYINNVNGKVLKSFYRSFGERPDVKWSKTESGFVASFKDNQIPTNAYFSSNGAIQYKVKYYAEDQLPKSVRHIVKSNFYDYSIIQVSEVQSQGSVCYLVKIEDEAFIKTIRIEGQEWQAVEELVKQL